MKPGLVVAVVLALAIVLPTAAAYAESTRRVCEDAPQLPGVASQFYDMWNNIYRHYTCEIIPHERVPTEGQVLS